MEKTRLRWTGIAVALLLFVGAGLSHISFNVDILKLLPTHLPQVKGLSLFLKHFAQPNELIVTVEAPTAEEADAKATALADVAEQATRAREARRGPAALGEEPRGPLGIARLPRAQSAAGKSPRPGGRPRRRTSPGHAQGHTRKTQRFRVASGSGPAQLRSLQLRGRARRHRGFFPAAPSNPNSLPPMGLSASSTSSPPIPLPTTRPRPGGSRASSNWPTPRAARSPPVSNSASPVNQPSSPISPGAWSGT